MNLATFFELIKMPAKNVEMKNGIMSPLKHTSIELHLHLDNLQFEMRASDSGGDDR